MKIRCFKTWAAAFAVTLLAAPAYALTINDPGVVGAASGETKDLFSGGAVSIATSIGQHLLDMAAGTTDATGCSVGGTTSCYQTSSTEYSGTLTGGTEVGGGTTAGFASYLYVVAKYNGNNGGYVLFHIPTLLAAGGTIPLYPLPLWGTRPGQYGLSHYVGFGSVPDGGMTLSLLGLALAGIGVARRYVKA